MPSMLNTMSINLIHPVAGLAEAYNSMYNTNTFDNTSTLSTGAVVFIVVLSLVLWVMTLVATYRLTHNSTMQVVLCLIFGFMYIFLAWIYYGFTNHKFTKIK